MIWVVSRAEKTRIWIVLTSKVRNEIRSNKIEKFGPNWKYQSANLSNFRRNFSICLKVLSNLNENFPTSRLSKFKLLNFSLFPTAFSNYTYPNFQIVFQKLSVDFLSANDAPRFVDFLSTIHGQGLSCSTNYTQFYCKW